MESHYVLANQIHEQPGMIRHEPNNGSDITIALPIVEHCHTVIPVQSSCSKHFKQQTMDKLKKC